MPYRCAAANVLAKKFSTWVTEVLARLEMIRQPLLVSNVLPVSCSSSTPELVRTQRKRRVLLSLADREPGDARLPMRRAVLVRWGELIDAERGIALARELAERGTARRSESEHDRFEALHRCWQGIGPRLDHVNRFVAAASPPQTRYACGHQSLPVYQQRHLPCPFSAATQPAPDLEPPRSIRRRCSQFVVLSMLLHLLLIVLFGNPTGGARRDEAWWGPLDVTLRPASPEPGAEFRLVPGTETSASGLYAGAARHQHTQCSGGVGRAAARSPRP